VADCFSAHVSHVHFILPIPFSTSNLPAPNMMFRALMLRATTPTLTSFPPFLLPHSPESFILDIQMKWFRIFTLTQLAPLPLFVALCFLFRFPHAPLPLFVALCFLFRFPPSKPVQHAVQIETVFGVGVRDPRYQVCWCAA
jgi:hypothetical protein